MRSLLFISYWTLRCQSLRSETKWRYIQPTNSGRTYVNKKISFLYVFRLYRSRNLLPASRRTCVLMNNLSSHPSSRHVAPWLKFTQLCKQSLEQGMVVVTVMKSPPRNKKELSQLISFLHRGCGKLHQFLRGHPT